MNLSIERPNPNDVLEGYAPINQLDFNLKGYDRLSEETRDDIKSLVIADLIDPNLMLGVLGIARDTGLKSEDVFGARNSLIREGEIVPNTEGDQSKDRLFRLAVGIPVTLTSFEA